MTDPGEQAAYEAAAEARRNARWTVWLFVAFLCIVAISGPIMEWIFGF